MDRHPRRGYGPNGQTLLRFVYFVTRSRKARIFPSVARPARALLFALPPSAYASAPMLAHIDIVIGRPVVPTEWPASG